MTSGEVLVCVLGLSRSPGHLFSSGTGVGKSCLCYRFLHPGFDDFISDHPSILAEHEFQSAAVNSTHFLYWGSRRQTLPSRLGKTERTVDIHVVENTVLYADVTSKPFAEGGGRKADNVDVYTKRALGKLESSGKISYWTRDGISLPDTYRPHRYPANSAKIRRGYAVVVDVSSEGLDFDAQLQRVKLISKQLRKADTTFVLVATKMESVVQESLDKLHRLKKKVHADIITTSAMCNYNIAATFKVVAEKILKSMHVSIPTFEQAADMELSSKTTAKRFFKNFATKWVQASGDRIDEVELTEQYRTCKSAVGKYETDRIFAFKLLEVKNLEMSVCANEDIYRRKEFLEDFIQMHPDLMLYQSQLLRRVEDLLVEALEQQTLEMQSTASSSPRTPHTQPRRVHHYPASDESSKHSSTTTSPALSREVTMKLPGKQLSVASATSLGACSAPDMSTGGAVGDIDTHSLGSFDSDDGIDYVNMQGYRKETDPMSSPSHTSPPTHHTPSSPILPLAIPPLGSRDHVAVATGNDGDHGDQQTRSVRRNRSVTHEWVCLPQSPPKTTSSVGIEKPVQSMDGTTDEIRDVPFEDGAVVDTGNVGTEEAPYDNMAADGGMDTLNGDSQDDPSGNGAVYHNTSSEPQDDPSGNGTVDSLEMQYDNTTTLPEEVPLGNGAAYQNEAIEYRDNPSDNGTEVDHTSSPVARDNPAEKTGADISGQPDTNAPGGDTSQIDPPSKSPREEHTSPAHSPRKRTKKPPPPPPKPKPLRVKQKSSSDAAKPTSEETSLTAASGSQATPKPHPLSLPSVEELSQSLNKNIRFPTSPPATGIPPPPPEDVASSGEEYVPSDYEYQEEMRTREEEMRKREGVKLGLKDLDLGHLMETERKRTPESEDEPLSPPPPIPVRSKGYHLVVLGDKNTKAEIRELPIPEAKKSEICDDLPKLEAAGGSSPSPQRSPISAAVSEGSPQSAPLEESGRYSESPAASTGKKRKKFYESWKLRKEEKKTKKQPSEEETLRKSGSEEEKASKPTSPRKHSKAQPLSSKKKKKQRKRGKPLQHTQSDRQSIRFKSSVKRAPSDSSKLIGSRRQSKSLPRQTFLNMKTRPLPEAPFVLPHELPDEHTLEDYDIVDKMLAPSRKSDTHHRRMQGAPVFPTSASSGSLQQRPRAQSSETTDSFDYNYNYMNEDQFPIPSGSVFRPGHMQSPTGSLTNFPSRTTARPLGVGSLNLSPTHSLPPSVIHRPVMDPFSIPHPLPLSARLANPPPRHLPLGQSTSNPHTGENTGSPEYSYTHIASLGLMLQSSRLHGAASIGAPRSFIPRSKSTDFDQGDDYVQMKPQVEQDGRRDDSMGDEHYQNFDVIESIRAMNRSRSMEDVHMYKNFPRKPGKEPTVFDRTLPLPARGLNPAATSHTCRLPPRDRPRWQSSAKRNPPPSFTGGTHHHDTVPPQPLPPSSVQSLPPHMLPHHHKIAPPQMLPSSVQQSGMNVFPSHAHGHVSPLPSSHTHQEQHVMADPFSLTSHPSRSHARHIITTSPPPPEIPRESPPHLEYFPKYKSKVVPPLPVSPSAAVQTTEGSSDNIRPPPNPHKKSSVGTSMWTDEDDPTANYYNVVSKSFFSQPKPLSPVDSSYLDILPD